MPLLGTLLTGTYEISGCFLFENENLRNILMYCRIISAYEDKVLTKPNDNGWFRRVLKISYKDDSFNSFVRLGMLKFILYIVLLNSP